MVKQWFPEISCPKLPKRLSMDGASVYNPEDTDYEDDRMVLEAAWEG